MTQSGDTPSLGPDGVALVPGELIPVLPLDLPANLRGSTREQVARRQLCDSAALDPNTAEIRPFLLGGHGESWSHALVADRSDIAAWTKAAPTNCRAVLPDYLALPVEPDLWSLRHDADSNRVLARLGLNDGFAADPALARLLLERALEIGPAPKSILWQGPDLATLTDLFDAAGLPLTQDAGRAKPFGHGELALDLRRDPFATRARLRRSVLPWRWPALVALLAAGVWATAQTLAIDALTTEKRAVQAHTLETVRSNFVPSGPVLDVRAQVSRALAETRSAALNTEDGLPPLTLFAATVDVISAPGITPERIEFRSEDGLRLLLEVTDFAASEALVSALRDSGLGVEVLRSEAGGDRDGVMLELQLEDGT
ncbi:type II secretion system protein GspL [Shimia sp. Alg240-R146]|uniref:type II secretion system protein GspL n=1 Tax=Shimia sp. Alg240-R146 TaxID=2993449 RepID=UPI0022E4AC27|nr:type II secretion system protein GspL [Shimia sp. Alg240-R146]